MLSALPFARLSDRLGRRLSIITLSAIFTLGAAIQLATVNLPMLLVGRFLAGVADGGFTSVCALYLSEIAPAVARGR